MRIAVIVFLIAFRATLNAQDDPRPNEAPLGPRVEITPRDGTGTRICHLRSFQNGEFEIIFGTGEVHKVSAADVATVRFVPPERPQPNRPDRPERPDPDQPERPEPGRPNGNGDPQHQPRNDFVQRALQFRALYRKKLRGKLDQVEAGQYERMDADTFDKPMVSRAASVMKAQEDATYAEETGKLPDFIEQQRKGLKDAERPDQVRIALERLSAGYREQGTIKHALLEKITEDIKLVKTSLRDDARRLYEELKGFINMPLNGVFEREVGPPRPRNDGRDRPPPQEPRDRPKP